VGSFVVDLPEPTARFDAEIQCQLLQSRRQWA
jgi:hypothetical protein